MMRARNLTTATGAEVDIILPPGRDMDVDMRCQAATFTQMRVYMIELAVPSPAQMRSSRST